MRSLKIFSTVLVFTLGAGFVQASEFSDAKNHPYATAIEYLHLQGIVSGYPDGTYQPDKALNRAELLKIIMEATLEDKEISECKDKYTTANQLNTFFLDVPRYTWYSPYVCIGKVNKVVQGYPDGTFQPGRNILYVEALKIIYEAYDVDGKKSPSGTAWYSSYTEDAARYEVNLNVDFAKQISRGEFAQLLYNFMTKRLPQENLAG